MIHASPYTYISSFLLLFINLPLSLPLFLPHSLSLSLSLSSHVLMNIYTYIYLYLNFSLTHFFSFQVMKMDNITYTYPGATKPTLNNIRLVFTILFYTANCLIRSLIDNSCTSVAENFFSPLIPLSNSVQWLSRCQFFFITYSMFAHNQSFLIHYFSSSTLPSVSAPSSVKLCLGSRVAVLGANGAGDYFLCCSLDNYIFFF